MFKETIIIQSMHGSWYKPSLKTKITFKDGGYCYIINNKVCGDRYIKNNCSISYKEYLKVLESYK